MCFLLIFVKHFTVVCCSYFAALILTFFLPEGKPCYIIFYWKQLLPVSCIWWHLFAKRLTTNLQNASLLCLLTNPNVLDISGLITHTHNLYMHRKTDPLLNNFLIQEISNCMILTIEGNGSSNNRIRINKNTGFWGLFFFEL